MDNFNFQDLHWGWWVAGVVVCLMIWSNPGFRQLIKRIFYLFVFVALVRATVHNEQCPGAQTCQLMPTWAGTCIPRAGAVLKADGYYYLTDDAGSTGSAICADVRVWR